MLMYSTLFAYAILHERAMRRPAKECLERLIAAVPYQIYTRLTDNGIQFAKREGTENTPSYLHEKVLLSNP